MLWSQSGFVIWQTARNIQYQYGRVRELSKAKDTIRLTNAEARNLTWVKKDEVSYRGRMFDIKSRIVMNDSTIMVGHYDSKDDNLLKRLSELLNSHKDGSSKAKISFWMCEAVLANTEVALTRFYPYKKNNGTFEPSLTSTILTTLSPPPKA
jgi:hypothetical protein